MAPSTLKNYYNEARIVLAFMNLDIPALLAGIVCVPLSLYGEWLLAVLCAAVLFAADRYNLQGSCQSELTWKAKVNEAKLSVAKGASYGEQATVGPLQKKQSFTVCAAVPADAAALTAMYSKDYVQVHRQMHEKPAADASTQEWEEALGKTDFLSVLQQTKSSPTGEVRLLKCVAEGSDDPIGYVLYELREKGPKGKNRQRFCELVNIVVKSDYRGCGAGGLMFKALRADLALTAPSHATDLRLFVAERNASPTAWYTRLGFTEAGWQSECLGGSEVRFLRMMFKPQA